MPAHAPVVTSAPIRRAVLVTGDAANIGRAITIGLAKNGFDVVVHAKSSADEAETTAAKIRRTGGKAEVLLAELSRRDEAFRLVDAAVSALGRLDVLVNNAALRRQVALAEIDEAEWRLVMCATLDAPFFTAQAAAPHLARSGAGMIVTIGGMAAHAGASHRVPAVTANAGIIGLTKALAVELAPSGITVNCVVPGLIYTVRSAVTGAPPALSLNLRRAPGRGRRDGPPSRRSGRLFRHRPDNPRKRRSLPALTPPDRPADRDWSCSS